MDTNKLAPDISSRPPWASGDIQQAYQTGSITESVVSFAQFARNHGMNVGIQETQDALIALSEINISERVLFKNVLKTIFCTSPEERLVFEKLFALFWDTNPADLRERKNKTSVQGVVTKKANASLVMLGRGRLKKTQKRPKTYRALMKQNA